MRLIGNSQKKPTELDFDTVDLKAINVRTAFIELNQAITQNQAEELILDAPKILIECNKLFLKANLRDIL
jgi:hypothetical protein